MSDDQDNKELLGEEYDEPLYCIDCGQILDRNDAKCLSCGAFQW